MAELASLSSAKRRLLEKYLRGAVPQPATGAGAILARPGQARRPLSLAQEQLWRQSRIPGIPPLFNESITVRRAGPLDVAALERSMAEIIRRHEIWRTSYASVDGQPVQIIDPAPATFPLGFADFSQLREPEREAEVARLACEQACRPFDLERGPLLRTALIRTGREEYRLCMTAHLSIVDGVSVYQVFPAELAQIYEAFCAEKPSPLPSPCIQYRDYACWQREWLQPRELERQAEYWRKQLAGPLPELHWPWDHPRPPRQTFRGAIRSFVLPVTLADRVRKLGQQLGVTLFTCLQAGFIALLHCYTAQEDMIIGTFSPAGRKRPETEGLIGHFLNPVALRFSLSGKLTFCGLLRQAQRLTAEAVSHDDVPLEYLAQELLHGSDPSRHPFFTAAVSLQPRTPNLPGWSVTSMDAESGGAFWDLYLAFIEQPPGMGGRVQYNPDLFEPSTITRMIGDLEIVLAAATEDPERPLSSLRV